VLNSEKKAFLQASKFYIQLEITTLNGDILTIAEKSIEINAPPEKIWPLIQWDRTPEWYPDWKKVEWTSKDKHKVGETVHIYVEAGGMKTELDYETTEVIENEKVAFRSTRKNFKATGFHSLTPTKTGTKVTIFADYELPYSVLGKLIDKLRFHKVMEKSFDVGLKKLKDMMEK
jgi:uncharacterized membrane protein